MHGPLARDRRGYARNPVTLQIAECLGAGLDVDAFELDTP
jgi:hypothetical protein